MTDESPLRRLGEHSPPSFGASTDPSTPWSAQLARACHEATTGARDDAIETVLRHLRESSGAERAFLLEASPSPAPPRLLAVSAGPRDVADAFSTNLASRALRTNRPLCFADLSRHPLDANCPSVRALGLHSVLTVPLPSVDERRLALVLDSRLPFALDAERGCSLALAFAGLVSLVYTASLFRPQRGPDESTGPSGPSSPFPGRLRSEIRSIAGVPLPVLVVGETGSGKELAARAIHEEGRGARRPFVAINCAAIPEALLERELFGAVRGSFTGADRDHPGLFRQADGGTLFLDEIGDMPVSLQAKLLRVIQESAVRAVGALEEKSIDVRLVAATHRDLSALVAEHRFRADLRWRLEVLVLHVPPLRERVDELPELSERLLSRLASRCRLAPVRVSKDALARLSRHRWPGNVRELESVLARALIRARDGVIIAGDLDFRTGTTADSPLLSPAQKLERRMIEAALHAARGNVTSAALRIGWSRQALYRRIHALGLSGDPSDPREPNVDQGSSGGDGTRSSDSSTFQ